MISAEFTPAEVVNIDAAASDWTRGTDSVVRFHKLNAGEVAAYLLRGNPFVTFKREPPAGCNGNSADYGVGSAAHDVNLCPNQDPMRIAHELGHTLGLFHEQQRADRDLYLTMHEDVYGCGSSGCCYQQTYDQTFKKTADAIGPFDTASIMMYGSGWNRPAVCEDGRTPRSGPESVSLFEWRTTGNRIVGDWKAVSPWDYSGAVELYRQQSGCEAFVPLQTPSTTAPPDFALAPGVKIASYSPAVASRRAGALDVVVLGSDGHLYHRWFDRAVGTSWSAWEDIGDGFVSAPSAVAWGPDRVDIVASKADRQVYWRSWNGGRWQPWVSIGFPSAGGTAPHVFPSIGANGTGRLAVVVSANVSMTNRSQTVWIKRFSNDTWSSSWQVAGGIVKSAPTIVGSSNGDLDVAVIGMNNSVWILHSDGRSWSQMDIGGRIYADLDAKPAISRRGRELEVFVTGLNQMLWENITDNGQWLGWANLGGRLRNSPAAVTWGSEAVYVVANVENQGLWYKRWLAQ